MEIHNLKYMWVEHLTKSTGQQESGAEPLLLSWFPLCLLFIICKQSSLTQNCAFFFFFLILIFYLREAYLIFTI